MRMDIAHAHKRILYRHYGSIFFKNLKLTALVIILPLALMVVICYIAFQNYTSGEINIYGGKTVRAIQSETDSIFNVCSTQMSFLLSDLDISVFLQTNRGDQMFYSARYIHKLILMQQNTLSYLSSVYIYSVRNGQVISNMGITEPKNLYDLEWLESYQANKGQVFWAEFRTLSSYPLFGQQQVISLYKTVDYGQGSSGVIVFNIDYSRFIRHIATLRGEYDVALSIADESGNLVANVWGDPADYLNPANISVLNTGKTYLQTGRLVLYRAPIADTHWQYVFAAPRDMFSTSISSLRNMLFGIAIGGMAATVIIAVLISFKIYRPFRNIASVLGKPLDYAETAAFNKNEEGYIISAIKKTIQENAAIGQELKGRLVMLKRAQNLALQTQISPHFLNNTLDAINWTAMRLTGGQNDASIMLGKLASMLRYCLESAETLVPLQQELDNLRTYLDLQMYRYKDKFTVEWDIADETRSVPVMKLLLQPLVENAIYHGIKPMEGEGLISVSSLLQGGCLLICVSDNGVGISPKALDKLNNNMKFANLKEEQHIGMGNVNQRIRLFFGDEFGISIIAAKMKGTQVRVTLPSGMERGILVEPPV